MFFVTHQEAHSPYVSSKWQCLISFLEGKMQTSFPNNPSLITCGYVICTNAALGTRHWRFTRWIHPEPLWLPWVSLCNRSLAFGWNKFPCGTEQSVWAQLHCCTRDWSHWHFSVSLAKDFWHLLIFCYAFFASSRLEGIFYKVLWVAKLGKFLYEVSMASALYLQWGLCVHPGSQKLKGLESH